MKLHQDSRVAITLARKFILEMYETTAITPARFSVRLSLSASYNIRWQQLLSPIPFPPSTVEYSSFED